MPLCTYKNKQNFAFPCNPTAATECHNHHDTASRDHQTRDNTKNKFIEQAVVYTLLGNNPSTYPQYGHSCKLVMCSKKERY